VAAHGTCTTLQTCQKAWLVDATANRGHSLSYPDGAIKVDAHHLGHDEVEVCNVLEQHVHRCRLVMVVACAILESVVHKAVNRCRRGVALSEHALPCNVVQ